MKSVKKLLSVLVVVIPVVALGIQLQAARLVRWYDAIHVVNWDETSIVTALMRYIDPFALAMNIIAVVIALIFVWLAKFDDPLKGVKKLLSALAVGRANHSIGNSVSSSANNAVVSFWTGE